MSGDSMIPAAKASTEDNILLKVSNLKMWFENRSGFWGQHVHYTKAVDDVSFYIKQGETLGLVGESGCGKTTVGRCIVRIYEPTAGEILYHDAGQPVDLASLKRSQLLPYRQQIRMIFQNPYSSLNPRMTVFENVAEVLIVNKLAAGQELEDRVASLLHRVGLRPEYMRRYPHAFSGGERQRIVIARALATNPRLIIADEAISALDVSIRAQILNLMAELQQEMGLTYLFIAHDLSVVRHICDRVNVMYVGKMVEAAPAKALYFTPKHPYTEALMSAVPIHNPRLRGKKERIRLTGDVADPSNPPSGCYFHPRCRYAQPECSQHEPPLRRINARTDHEAACHFAEDLDLKGVVADANTDSSADAQPQTAHGDRLNTSLEQ